MSSKKIRIMYIEDKSAGLNGPARIGRVTLSKSTLTFMTNIGMRFGVALFRDVYGSDTSRT